LSTKSLAIDHEAKAMRKTTRTIVALFFLCLFVINASSQKKDTNEIKEKILYGKMSGILLQYDPGIDYSSLHEAYRRLYPSLPLVWNEQQEAYGSQMPLFFAQQKPKLFRILVLIAADLYAEQSVRKRIDRYADDIRSSYGSEVILVTVSGGYPKEIKALIQSYYYGGGLDGAIFIGRIVPAWYEVPNDHYWWEGGYGYADWTCDLFYMDLDGQWEDTNFNGIYDSHTSGAGDVGPEIFVGRIDTSTMLGYGEEIELLNRYLDKNHQYWMGNISFTRYGLAYHDHDWRNETTFYFNNFFGSGNYESRKWNSSDNPVTRNDYQNKRLVHPVYEFIETWTHASYIFHDFHTGGRLYHYDIWESQPRALGYNINGCHAFDWAAGGDQRFLGGSYVYNQSVSSLVAVGSTKTGGMLGFDSFYQSLGKNNCIGKALVDWFTERLNSGEEKGYIIGWHYGMMIVGDPLICFQHVPGSDFFPVEIYPPLNVSVKQVENRSLFFREWINVLTWEANSENNDSQVASYRIYVLSEDKLVLLDQVEQNVFSFYHRNVKNQEYWYALSAVNAAGEESRLVYVSIQ
jgi:hypothetical protein